MSLEKVVYTLQEQLSLLGRQLRDNDPAAPLFEELTQLDEEEDKLRRGLGRWQLDVQAARQQLNDLQSRAALLISQIEALVKSDQGPEVYRLAMELDQVRHDIPETAKRLPPLEQTCWSLQFRIRQLRRRRELLKGHLRTSG